MSGSRRRWVLWLLSAAAIAVPCLVVRIPPVTDLPQHLGQMRLFIETLGTSNGPFAIQPLTPYWGAHLVLLPVWLVAPARAVASLSLLLLGLLWVGAVHALAWRRDRAPVAAVLASVFFFSQSLYWGFIPFLVGWPLYLLWLQVIQRTDGSVVAVLVRHTLCAALLYACHALWFAMAMLTLAAHWATRRPGWRAVFRQAVAVLPVGLLALWWYPQLAQRGFTSPPLYIRDFAERLSPPGLLTAALGGLRDSVEGPVLLLVVGWLGLGLWQHRRELRGHVDGALLVPALLLTACALVLPDKYSNTILLAERWLPCAMVLLLLALPPPRLPSRALHAWSAAALLLLSGFTAMTWQAFEQDELEGLETAVDAVPQGARLLGLAYPRESALVLGRPFLQAFSYAYVLRGATLSFSFAWFAPSPVVQRDFQRPPWTPGLTWNPEHATTGDFQYFDHVLVALDGDESHDEFARAMPVTPVTRTGRWRLYRSEPTLIPSRPGLRPIDAGVAGPRAP
ncbi:hypothetical protein LZ198_40060 [Myxococcus sp. K15C18031901]|uniref:hypothetical protein n=1 Tax=Myxococcus dinghuensis TaxID=2906761 RepID=UPI0020A738A3|nr:hypothetical protein [Myxococcus dinghuensis]MCP3105080.1 hypothetical protein [Myxococcus dinghuensis]